MKYQFKIQPEDYSEFGIELTLDLGSNKPTTPEEFDNLTENEMALACIEVALVACGKLLAEANPVLKNHPDGVITILKHASKCLRCGIDISSTLDITSGTLHLSWSETPS